MHPLSASSSSLCLLAVAALVLAACGEDPAAPPVPSALAFITQPSTAAAGETFSPAPRVEIRDEAGAIVASSNAAVTLALGANPESGTLGGSVTVNAVNGVATFGDLSIDQAAAGYTLVATSPELDQATSEAFDVGPAAASRLVFDVQPSGAVAGEDIAPAIVVSVQDAFGNTTDAEPDVTLALEANPGGATLDGTVTVTAADGVATFSGIAIRGAATGYTLRATAPGLAAATSASFDIAAGAADRLAFTAPPANAEPQGPVASVQVEVQDAFGNRVDAAVDITLALAQNPSAATLAGTLTRASAGGVATFDDLAVDAPGDGYTLAASATDLDASESDGFDVILEFVQISAAESHTCGVTVAGSAYCWGDNSSGRLGVEGLEAEDFPFPQRVSGGHTFTMLSAGFEHSCAVRTDGAAMCWGSAGAGRLGNEVDTGTFDSPQLVAGGHTFTVVATGELSTCGVRASDGAALCWGWGGNGRLGNGETTAQAYTTPQLVLDDHVFSTVTTGLSHGCGIRATDGAALCWGNAGSGRLGNGETTGEFSTPQLVSGDLEFSTISGRSGHTCALTVDGAGYCWGSAISGRLGNNVTADDFPTPQPVVGGLTLTGIAAGNLGGCAIAVGGAAYCWGSSASGRLGNGDDSGTIYAAPVLVLGNHVFTETTAGVSFGSHACAVSAEGGFCWGANSNGTLGDGSFLNSSQPVRVAGSR